MKYVFATCFSFLALSHIFACAQRPAVGATVLTSSGSVTGHAARNRTEVSEYLGIPYAQPPIGHLRFAAPRTYNNSKAHVASAYSPDCPQMGESAPPLKYPGQTPQFPRIVDDFAGGRGNLQSEDCLTLNIWTKYPSSAEKKGVLVWIHGGRFIVGDTNTPFYQGQYLVDSQDIVFVSINYRLNIFGFSGAPGETPNVGLLDQRKAIEWVRDNIAGFGGDPHRITIMGQSVGGVSVDYYSYAHLHDPIVAGLISHSGTARSFPPNTPQFARSSFLTAAASLGCSGSNVVDCMRQKPFQAVLNATTKVKPLPAALLTQPVFYPMVDNVTVFGDYGVLSAAGAFARIPYLVGNCDHEDGWYRVGAAASNVTLSAEQWLLYDLISFTCASATEAAARTQHGVPVYRFRYFGVWPNLELYPGSGAYHGSDLHMIFGAAEDVTGLPDTPRETRTTEYMMGAWASFVRDPARGLASEMGWPLYDPRRETLVRLGFGDGPGASFAWPLVYDGRCPANESVARARGRTGTWNWET